MFNVVCCKRLSSPRCRSELIESAWVVIVPEQKATNSGKATVFRLWINSFPTQVDVKRKTVLCEIHWPANFPRKCCQGTLEACILPT